jgi:hypothetical protein
MNHESDDSNPSYCTHRLKPGVQDRTLALLSFQQANLSDAYNIDKGCNLEE